MGTAAMPQIIKTNGTKIPSPSTPTVNANRIAIPRNAAGMRKSFFSFDLMSLFFIHSKIER